MKSVKLDNHFLDGHCLLAFANYNLKEYDRFMEATEDYLAAWSRITNSYSSKTESGEVTDVIYHTIGHKWKIHLLRGFCYLSNNQNEFGNSEINKAINESSDMENCLTLLGNYYFENDSIDKAEDTYKRLLDINKNAVNALFNLGHIKFQKKDLNATLSFWKKAVEIAPDSFDIRLLICKVNITLGNFEDIIVGCDQLLQILNMSRDLTIESLSDMGNIFDLIGKNLKERNEVQPAETAYRICKEFKQLESIDTACVSRET